MYYIYVLARPHRSNITRCCDVRCISRVVMINLSVEAHVHDHVLGLGVHQASTVRNMIKSDALKSPAHPEDGRGQRCYEHGPSQDDRS
jgi:hypothetical protein